MPKTIIADGRRISVPDDATPEEINQIVGPAKAPGNPTDSFRPQPTGPIQTPLNWLENLRSDVKHGTDVTLPGRILKTLGARGTDMGVPEAVGDIMPGGGTIQGAAKAAHGVGRVLQGHPIKGANEIVRGAGQTLAPVLGVTQPEFLPTALGYGAAGAGIEKGAKALGAGEDTSELLGNLVTGLLGGKKAVDISDKKAAGKLSLAGGKGTVEPIEQTVKTIQQAAGKTPPQTVGDLMSVVNKAKDDINREYGNALGPAAQTEVYPHDPSGQAIIPARIRALKSKFSPIDAEGRQAQAIIERAALDYDKPLRLGDLDTKRTHLNTELSKINSKTPSARYTAKHGDVNTLIDSTIQDALRETIYPEADRLAGKSSGYFEKLKQQQMNLIRLQNSLETRVKDLHDTTVRAKAAPPLDRAQVRGNVGEGGNPRFFLSNVLGAIHTPNPEAKADKAVRGAFKESSAAPLVMGLPIKALLAGDVTDGKKKGVAAALTPAGSE